MAFSDTLPYRLQMSQCPGHGLWVVGVAYVGTAQIVPFLPPMDALQIVARPYEVCRN